MFLECGPAAFKNFMESYLIFLYLGEWWKGTICRQRCVRACVYVYDSPIMASTVSVSSSHPRQPLQCFLLQAAPWSHTWKKCWFFFPWWSFSLSCMSHTFPFFNKTRWSRWLWHTRSLGIDCQFDRVTAYIPHHGELAVHIAVWALFPISGSVTGLTRRKGHVYICLLYYEGFAHFKKTDLVISSKRKLSLCLFGKCSCESLKKKKILILICSSNFNPVEVNCCEVYWHAALSPCLYY